MYERRSRSLLSAHWKNDRDAEHVTRTRTWLAELRSSEAETDVGAAASATVVVMVSIVDAEPIVTQAPVVHR